MATTSTFSSTASPTKLTSISPKPPSSTRFTPPIIFPNHNPKNPKSISSSPSPRPFPTCSSPNLRSSLKSRLAAGETLYGLFLLSSSPTLAEIAGLAGYDYVVVDMEHGPGGFSDALPCLRALASTSTPSVLRLPESSPTCAKKALDLGPQGVMFPAIDDAESAALAVSFCRFPPRGVRGSAHTVVRASAYGLDAGYLGSCEDDLLIMCQIESASAAREVEAIAAVDGVDCLQMGPLDLSASMGCLWDPGNEKVRARLREVEGKVLGLRNGDKGPYLAGFAMPFDPPGKMKLRGYHMVAGAVDVGMFRDAAVEDVMRFRQMETTIGEEEEEEDDDEEERLYWSE